MMTTDRLTLTTALVEARAALEAERARVAALVAAATVVVRAVDTCPYCLEILNGEQEHTDDCPWPALEEALNLWAAQQDNQGQFA